MPDVLLFVHGTGVRQTGYDQTMALLKQGFANAGRAIEVDGLCWGPSLGVKIDDNDIAQVLPTAFSKAVDANPDEIGVGAALWMELLNDPLFELRLASIRPPQKGSQSGAELGVVLPDIVLTSLINEFRAKVQDPLPGGVSADELRAAAEWLISQSPLRSAAAAVGDATDADLLHAVARAIVAKSLVNYRTEIGVGPAALYVASDRDALVDAIVSLLPQSKGFGSWLWSGVRGFAESAATRYGRDRRAGLVNGASLVIGDILLYQRRGQEILAAIEQKILDLAKEKGPVVVLGHSLGGIMMVDLLSRPRQGAALPVAKLITVGSQAPALFKFDALDTMRLNKPLAAGTPFRPWLNIYDRNDFLSFCANRTFPGNSVEDFEITSNVSFPEAHSAYFRQPLFFQKICQDWPKL